MVFGFGVNTSCINLFTYTKLLKSKTILASSRVGLWGPLLHSANQLHAALYIVSENFE